MAEPVVAYVDEGDEEQLVYCTRCVGQGDQNRLRAVGPVEWQDHELFCADCHEEIVVPPAYVRRYDTVPCAICVHCATDADTPIEKGEWDRMGPHDGMCRECGKDF